MVRGEGMWQSARPGVRAEQPRRYVLTGAPGAGKTSILHGLQARGYAVVEEAATDLIAGEHQRGIDEPWRRDDFIAKIVRLQRERQLRPVGTDVGIQIYDRSPVCTVA